MTGWRREQRSRSFQWCVAAPPFLPVDGGWCALGQLVLYGRWSILCDGRSCRDDGHGGGGAVREIRLREGDKERNEKKHTMWAGVWTYHATSFDQWSFVVAHAVELAKTLTCCCSQQSKQIFQEWNHNAETEQTTNSSFHGTIYYLHTHRKTRITIQQDH